MPLHPRTLKQLKTFGLYEKLSDHVKLTEPFGYLEFTKLLNNADKVLTDSGGVQKEAYIFKVPCITLRDNTEWVETVEDGWNVLVGVDVQKIIKALSDFNSQSKYSNIFGKGACKRISEIIKV
jgi:UDP-N-acetylglucosamine 2-epimerase (non-hydrolysing)